MIADRRVIAVIPARGGSKAIPKKSIAMLGAKTLLERAVSVAMDVEAIDRIIVSTDSDEIAAVARRAGAEVYGRSPELATDTSLIIETLRDLIRRLVAEGEQSPIIVLLEVTAPFRTPADVAACLDEISQGADSVATFTTAATSPHKAWRLEEGRPTPFVDGADPWLPRQRTPKAWELNGAVYAFDARKLPERGASLLFGEAVAVEMPRSRSFDINDPLDLKLAEFLLQEVMHDEPR